MPIVEEKYDQRRIDSIRRSLQREADKGRPRDFEIIVDGFKVVPRTNDLIEFDEYEQEIRDNTRNVSFLLYDGPGTNRNTRYSFSFQQQGSPEQVATLGEIDGVIAQKLAERDKDYELARLREKLLETETQLTEAEQYADQLQNRITELEQDGKGRMIKLGDLGASIIMGVLRNSARNSDAGKALAGLLGIEDATPPLPSGDTSEPEGQVSYQRQEPALDENTRHRLALLEQMQQRLDERQMVGVLNIIGYLTDNPQQINVVIELLQSDKHNK